MRSKVQIARIIYDALSDAKWTKLRDALNGSELIAIATELVYAYEQRYRGLSYEPTTHTKAQIKQTLEALMPSYLTGAVYDELLLWGIETVYQIEQAKLKDYHDTNWETATSYAALLNIAKKTGYQFPVIDFNPSSIVVQLPAGDQTYLPYSIAVSAGTAVFYNIIPYSAGDQAILFQGIPYSYNHSTDISGYDPCAEYTTKVITSDLTTENTYFSRYVKLPKETLPASVGFFTDAGELSRWTALYPSGDKYKMYNLEDGGLAVFLSDNTSWGQDFASDASDWCIRFLSLTDIEFDSSSLQLPEGYILLTTQNAVKDDLEYAKNVFAKYYITSSSCTYTTDLIRRASLCFPGVQDCNVVTSDMMNFDVYVKPIQEVNNIIFTELEDFLNDNLTTRHFTTYCASYLQFMFILQADISLSLRSKVETYLREKYAYSNMLFLDNVDSVTVKSDLDEMFNLSAYDPNFDVTIRIKHDIDRTSWTDDTQTGTDYCYHPGSISIYKQDGKQCGWDDADTHKIYCATTGTSYSDLSIEPNFVLASSTGKNLQAPAKLYGYDFRNQVVNDGISSTVNTFYNKKIYLGGNCAYALVDNGTTGTLYLYPLNTDYFKNPAIASWDPTDATYAYTLDSALTDVLKLSMDNLYQGVPAIAFDGDHTIYLLSIDPSSSTVPEAIYILNLNLSPITSSSAIKRYIDVPDMVTSMNYSSGDLYLTTDDGTILWMHNLKLSTWTQSSTKYCKSYKLQDSYGNILADTSNITWKFDNVPSFSMYIGNTGQIQIIILDNETPSTTRPSFEWSPDSSASPQIIDMWSGLSQKYKQQINSKWHVYSANRFKVTARGLELINYIEERTIPSLYADTLTFLSLTSGEGLYIVPVFGPVLSAGVNGSVFAYGQALNKLGYTNDGTFTFDKGLIALGVWVHDTTTNYVSVPDPTITNRWTSISAENFYSEQTVYTVSEVGDYSYGPSYNASATLSDGYPLGKQFVVEMRRACAQDDRYVKLDEQLNIVWVS